MRSSLATLALVAGAAAALAACAPRTAMLTTPGPDGQPAPAGESYDPPGSTITTGRPITDQERITWTDPATEVTVSNEFAGGRLSGFEPLADGTLRLVFRPENAPINNSAWFAFAILAPTERRVTVELTYEGGDHRYVPKLSRDRLHWVPVAAADYRHDAAAGSARVDLDIGPEPLWVAGQEVTPSAWFDSWTEELVAGRGAERTDIGSSVRGRPLRMLSFGNATSPEGLVVIVGRQHPPETTGTLGLVGFVDAMLGDDPTALEFRSRYRTVVIPLVNPDGVDEGHWRHNAAGVDLNRDWLHFNQPEVRVVRDALRAEAARYGVPVVFAADFHSTQEDIFYTHTPDFETVRGDLVARWLRAIAVAVPDYEVVEEAGGIESPNSKNWFWSEWKAPSVIYEVGDEQDRGVIARVADAGALAMMRLVLEGGDGR